MLSQMNLQCGLFDVDISRELSRSILTQNKHTFFVKKGEKDVFFKMFPFHPFPKIKSNMTEELLLDKYHTLTFLFLLLG